MSEIKTYAVTVAGFDPVLFSARSPAKARSRAWSAYCSFRACSFREFLTISSIRRAPDPPGVGERIMVGGKPGTTVIGSSGHYVSFMRDDSDVVLYSHPHDVARSPSAIEQRGE